MAQNINEKTTKKIKEILDYAVKNKRSSVYRKFEGKDFARIPETRKEDFINIPIEKRTFLPDDQILSYSTTSGTTKSKKIFTVPFSRPSISFYGEKLKDNSLKELGVTKIMLLVHPLHGMVRHFVYSKEKMPPYVLGKIDNLELCAQIIKETGVDGLVTTPTILEAFISVAQKYGVLAQIRWIIMAGEHCSTRLRDTFAERMPKALIDFAYGSTETGIMGLRCKHLSEKDPNIFHLTDEVFAETITENGEQAELGKEGKILITSLVKTAFPLIKYNIGDLGILRKEKCQCGKEYTIEVLGRADFDSIKTKGVVIHAQAIELALSKFYDLVDSSSFRLDVYEGDKPELILKVKNIQKFLPGSFDQDFSKELWLSQKSTLFDLIEGKIFKPLKVEILEEQKNASGKKRYIYYHR